MIVQVMLSAGHMAVVSTVKTFGPERGVGLGDAEGVALVQNAITLNTPLIGDDGSYILLKPSAVVGYFVRGEQT